MHDKNINISIPAKGKALYYFLGSSVTYGSATNGVSFVDLIPQQLQVNVVKEAVSGTTLVDTGSDSYVQRLRRMNTNSKVDHLIVQLSTNDASLNKTLGSVSAAGTTSFDTSTIIGAIEDIIYYAKNTLGCDVTFYTNPNYSNSKYQEMVEALYSVQEKWGIGIIDFYNISDMNAQALSSKGYMADSIHPNDKGYKWMTEVFVSYLRADYSSKHPGDSI